MDLCQFLNFNKDCPVCGKPLTLYARILNGPLWKGVQKSPNLINFEQFKCKNKDFDIDDFFCLTSSDNYFKFDFSSAKIYQNSKTWTFFFFLLCNEAGFEESVHSECVINPCVGCYFRSSQLLEFQELEDKNWKLACSRGIDPINNHINNEIFAFPVPQSGGEKMYIFNMDYENKNAILRYYSVTKDQMEDPDFDPNIFKLTLPIPNVRPNFDKYQRAALISRFDSWIMLS